MPGKYLEFIKAGRFVVPVEISFLSATLKEEPSGRDLGHISITSKWVERSHWKEIKALLKPAVEDALKFNDQPVEKISKTTKIAFGQDVGLGYVLGTNKDKSPFLSILNAKRHCWTDDEDEEPDENTRLRDCGGTFKSFTPTRVYISCAILKKTISTTEDNRRLRKELGSISEDLRTHFQPQPTNSGVLAIPAGVDTTPINSIDKVHLLFGMSDDRQRKSAEAANAIASNSISTPPITPHYGIRESSGQTTNDSLTGLDSGSEFMGKKKGSEDHYDEEIRKWRYERKTIVNKNDSFWNNISPEGSCYEERDDEGSGRSASTGEFPKRRQVTREHNMQALYTLNFDDDTFSLPDIDTPIKSSSNSNGIEFGSFATHTFNSFGRKDHPILHHEEKKKSPKKKSNRARRAGDQESSDGSDILKVDLSNLMDQTNTKPTKKKRKRTSSAKNASSSLESFSCGVSYEYEEAIRAFEYRNSTIEPDPLPTTYSPPPERLSISELPPVKSSPTKRKRKEKTNGYKKSPTISPPRLQKKTTSPVVSKVSSPRSSPIQKAVSPSKSFEAPLVARRIFPLSSTGSTSPTRPSVSLPSLPNHSQKEKHHDHESEVQVLRVTTKPIRKSVAAKLAAQQQVSPTSTNKSLLTKIKKEKGLRKESQSQPVPGPSNALPRILHVNNEEIDPEMPILECMVFNVEPASIPNIILKKEPEALSPSKASSEVLQTPVRKKKRRRIKRIGAANKITTKKGDSKKTLKKKSPARAKVRKAVQNAPKTMSATPPGAIRIPARKSVGVTLSSRSIVGNRGTSTENEIPLQTAQEKSNAQIPSTSQAAILYNNNNVASRSETTDDLFSFDNLDKSPPKFISPSTVTASVVASAPFTAMPSSPPTMFSNENVQTGATMMPPPIRRPPRVSRNPPSGLPVPVPLASSEINSRNGSNKTANPRPEIGVQVNPAQLSTIDLLRNPNLLRAGMGLLTQYTSNKIHYTEVEKRMGLAEDKEPEKPKRSPSPDICSGPPNKTPKEVEAELMPPPRAFVRTTRTSEAAARPDHEVHDVFTHDPPARSDSAEEDSYLSDPDLQEGGEALVRELISRYNNRDLSYYEPEGDDFDMSQRSYCMVNVFPDYQQKSRLFKIHSKNISELNRQNVVEQFQAILPEMVSIFQGSGNSDRHKMYLVGPAGRNHLKDMNVSLPFNNEHGSTLITLLFEYFVPDVSARQHWTNYINYVMLPESFIRIYARVNDLSYTMAETEMRYGACYDDPDPKRLF